ncbi:MAG: LysM domain-containing protein [Hungatella sp.]
MGELYNPFPKLPKNIRQIGERDQMVKLYVEDYVNTYLKRLYPKGGQDLRVGLLLGSAEEQEGTPYLFVDGAIEMEAVTEDGEKVVFSEGAWKKAYEDLEQMFPKRTVLGWFLCGAPGSQLSPLNYWKQHGQYFAGKNQLMYLNSGLEGEEAIYITSEDGFYKLRGHSIYYERNQMMQDYMILRKDARRVESGSSDAVIHDFRQRMDDNKTQMVAHRSAISVLGSLCSVLSIMVLAGGVVMFNNYGKMKQMETVIASALPEKTNPQVLVEEAPGRVYPTTAAAETAAAETAAAETAAAEMAAAETIAAETMIPELPAAFNIPETEAASTLPIPAKMPLKTDEELPEPAAKASANQTTYIIQEGETLYGICIKFYHDLSRREEICRLNGLEDENKIISGQTLIMPN